MTVGFVAGDVVFIPEGPFQGICGVVREVRDSGRLALEIMHAGGRYPLVVEVHEVEPA